MVLPAITASCSDDQITKQEFIDQTKRSDPPVDPAIASCVYDNVKQNKSVMADLTEHGAASNKISQDTDATLTRILARCIKGAEAAPKSG